VTPSRGTVTRSSHSLAFTGSSAALGWTGCTGAALFLAGAFLLSAGGSRRRQRRATAS
jgi:hypothetical protein